MDFPFVYINNILYESINLYNFFTNSFLIIINYIINEDDILFEGIIFGKKKFNLIFI